MREAIREARDVRRAALGVAGRHARFRISRQGARRFPRAAGRDRPDQHRRPAQPGRSWLRNRPNHRGYGAVGERGVGRHFARRRRRRESRSGARQDRRSGQYRRCRRLVAVHRRAWRKVRSTRGLVQRSRPVAGQLGTRGAGVCGVCLQRDGRRCSTHACRRPEHADRRRGLHRPRSARRPGRRQTVSRPTRSVVRARVRQQLHVQVAQQVRDRPNHHPHGSGFSDGGGQLVCQLLVQRQRPLHGQQVRRHHPVGARPRCRLACWPLLHQPAQHRHRARGFCRQEVDLDRSDAQRFRTPDRRPLPALRDPDRPHPHHRPQRGAGLQARGRRWKGLSSRPRCAFSVVRVHRQGESGGWSGYGRASQTRSDTGTAQLQAAQFQADRLQADRPDGAGRRTLQTRGRLGREGPHLPRCPDVTLCRQVRPRVARRRRRHRLRSRPAHVLPVVHHLPVRAHRLDRPRHEAHAAQSDGGQLLRCAPHRPQRALDRGSTQGRDRRWLRRREALCQGADEARRGRCGHRQGCGAAGRTVQGQLRRRRGVPSTRQGHRIARARLCRRRLRRCQLLPKHTRQALRGGLHHRARIPHRRHQSLQQTGGAQAQTRPQTRP